MVLAKAVEGNVAHHNSVIPLLLDERVTDNGPGAHPIAFGEEGHRLGHPAWRVQQALASGLLPDGHEQSPRDLLEIIATSVGDALERAHPAVTSAELFSDSTSRTLTS